MLQLQTEPGEWEALVLEQEGEIEDGAALHFVAKEKEAEVPSDHLASGAHFDFEEELWN